LISIAEGGNGIGHVWIYIEEVEWFCRILGRVYCCMWYGRRRRKLEEKKNGRE